MRDRKIEVVESYRDFVPPLNVVRIVERLLDMVPGRFLSGLSHMMITNTGALSHERRRLKIWIRGRKYPITGTATANKKNSSNALQSRASGHL